MGEFEFILTAVEQSMLVSAAFLGLGGAVVVISFVAQFVLTAVFRGFGFLVGFVRGAG